MSSIDARCILRMLVLQAIATDDLQVVRLNAQKPCKQEQESSSHLQHHVKTWLACSLADMIALDFLAKTFIVIYAPS